VLGVLGVLATFWWLGESITTVAQVPVWALAVGALLTATNYLFGGLRLALLTSMTGEPVGFGRSLRAYTLGLLSAAITPGGSGQAPAVVLSLVRDGVPASRAWSVNVYVWVVDLFFLTWSVPIGLVALGHSTDLLRNTSPVALAVPLSVLFLSLNYVLAYRLHWIKAVVGPVMRLRFLRRWRVPALEFLDGVAQATSEFSRRGIGLQVILHALTAGLYIATYLAFYFILVGMGARPPLLPTIAAVQLPMVVSFLFPTPGGAGIMEIASASLFSAEGGGGYIGAAILAWRLLTYYSRYAIGPAAGGTVLVRARGARGRRRARQAGSDAGTSDEDAKSRGGDPGTAVEADSETGHNPGRNTERGRGPEPAPGVDDDHEHTSS